MPTHSYAYLEVPKDSDRKRTTLPLNVKTHEGKRVCQQILKDMAGFWEGKPIEYLALYVRDW